MRSSSSDAKLTSWWCDDIVRLTGDEGYDVRRQ